MIVYNDNHKTGELHIRLALPVSHGCDFLNELTELSQRIITSNSESVFISISKESFSYDALGLTYFVNLLQMFCRIGKIIYLSSWLIRLFEEKIGKTWGKFEKIDLLGTGTHSRHSVYRFSHERDVEKAVATIVDFIHNNSMFLTKNYLVTVLGEIFSNAFTHSEDDMLYFMYDIKYIDDVIVLIINVTDFGKTIVANVREHLYEKACKSYTSTECLGWAMRSGNTTRATSGGYGLSLLVDYITAIRGELFIFTGNCFYTLKDGYQDILYSKGTFYGTSISLQIPLFDTLPAIHTVGYDDGKGIDINDIQSETVNIDLNEL